jgi:hypothetical protein
MATYRRVRKRQGMRKRSSRGRVAVSVVTAADEALLSFICGVWPGPGPAARQLQNHTFPDPVWLQHCLSI